MKRFSSTVLLSAAAEKKDDFGSLSALLPALGFGSQVRSSGFRFRCKGALPDLVEF